MRIRTLGALASLGALLTGTQTTPDASPQPVPTPAALTERQTEEHARVVQAVPLVAPEPEPFKPLFNGQNLEGWQPPKAHPDRFVATDGVLRIIGKSAWLLTSQAYDDFVLTFEARPVGPDSVGGILVRTLILPKHRLAYEVQVANGQKASAVLLQHADDSVLPGLDPPPTLVSADGEWHRYRVECVEDRISLSRDDAEVLKGTGLLLTTGPIAVHAASGIVELRNVRIQLIAPRGLTLPQGLLRSDGPGVAPPIRRPEWCPPPSLVPLAQRLGVRGKVVLECVVGADGRVQQCVVTRRVFGPLDEEVLRTVMRWRFEPATIEGQPVPILIIQSYNYIQW